jgi:hypothetical protein
MAYTYNTFVTSLANLLVVPPTDPNFITVLPNIIDDAEQRIYRELDLLNTLYRDSSAALVTGNRNFNLPTSIGIFLVVDLINVITPSGTTNPELGTRNQLLNVSRARLDFLYPSSTGATIPKYFSMINQGTIAVGPWPDANYRVEVLGTQRPAPLSVSNPTTMLSLYLPDLFFAASMVFASGYQLNFSAMSDAPQQSVSWESHYQQLKGSAATEEASKKITTLGARGAVMATPTAGR